jgi:putative iron-only hydrogenase system regulator
MEKRIGVIAILVKDRESVSALNNLLSNYNDMILGRQGMPIREKNIHIISIIIEGDTDKISSLTGKLGRIPGLEVKSMLTSYKE